MSRHAVALPFFILFLALRTVLNLHSTPQPLLQSASNHMPMQSLSLLRTPALARPLAASAARHRASSVVPARLRMTKAQAEGEEAKAPAPVEQHKHLAPHRSSLELMPSFGRMNQVRVCALDVVLFHAACRSKVPHTVGCPPVPSSRIRRLLGSKSQHKPPSFLPLLLSVPPCRCSARWSGRWRR